MPRKPKTADPDLLKIVAAKACDTFQKEIDFEKLEAVLGDTLSEDQRADLELALGFAIEGRRTQPLPHSMAPAGRLRPRRRGRPKSNAAWEVLIDRLIEEFENTTHRKATVSSSYERIRTGNAVAQGGAFTSFVSSFFEQLPKEMRPALSALPALAKRRLREKNRS